MPPDATERWGAEAAKHVCTKASCLATLARHAHPAEAGRVGPPSPPPGAPAAAAAFGPRVAAAAAELLAKDASMTAGEVSMQWGGGHSDL